MKSDLAQKTSELVRILEIHEPLLAGMLGITTKSLNKWKNMKSSELPLKVKRLELTYEIVSYITQSYPGKFRGPEIKNVLENGRVIIDPNDEDDGATSLISFICAHPEEIAWVAVVKEAVNNYLEVVRQEKANPGR